MFNFGVGSVSPPSVTSSQFLHLRQKWSRRVHRDCNSPLSSSLPALLILPNFHILSFYTCQAEKGFSSQILAKGGINIVLSIHKCVSWSCLPSRTSFTVNRNTWADFEQTHTVSFRVHTHTQNWLNQRCFQIYEIRLHIAYMSHSQMLGKVESGGGPIFKVVLEC